MSRIHGFAYVFPLFLLATTAAADSIQGHAWNDVDGNGVWNGSESARPGESIELIDAGGSVITSTITAPDGSYSFGNLADGPYVVRVAALPGCAQTYPGFRTTFTAGTVTGDWAYVDDPAHGLHGPDHWGEIADDANGYFQSPIDLPSAGTTDLGAVITLHYESTSLEAVFSNGHTVEAEYPHSGFHNALEAGAEEFELLQFHFHSPAENTVDGVLYDAEAHFVHRHANGGLSVLGVFLTAGAFNPQWEAVFQHMPLLSHSGDEVLHPADMVDADDLLPMSMDGWFFEGSLTTPPASQPVNWFVLATPVEVSQAQLDAYRTAADDADHHHDFYPGNRPVQALNGRQLNERNHEVALAGSATGVDFGLDCRQDAAGTDDQPRSFTLEPNFPNPFNPSTVIRFSLERTSEVQLVVFDLAGREVAVIHSGLTAAGRHDFVFDGAALASGIYFLRLETEEGSLTRKMILEK